MLLEQGGRLRGNLLRAQGGFRHAGEASFFIAPTSCAAGTPGNSVT